MSTIRQQRVVRPNIGEVSSKANTLSRQLSHLWPINADDGQSSPTRMRMPFALRELSADGFSVIANAGISYRPQASVGSIKYYAFQTDTNWILTSEDLPNTVDTTINSDYDIFLQSTGDTLMVYGYDGTNYRSFSFQGGVYTEASSTALAVSSAAFTSLNSGEILGVGGDNLYSMAATGTLIDSFPLQLNVQPVIESIGSQAIVSLDNNGIDFHLVDASGIVDTFSGGRTASYVGSTPIQGGVAFWYTTGGDYDFYLVSADGVEYTFTITSATLAAELVGTEKEVVYVMLYDSADKDISEDNLSVRFVIREVSANQNGQYKLEEFTIESEAPSTVFDRKLIMNSDAAIYANPTLGCADEFTLNSSSPVYAGSTFILDTSYYPASILKPTSGGGGGGSEKDTLQTVTDRGATTTNNIVVNGLTATTDPIDAQGDLRAQSNLRFDAYAPTSGHNLLIVGTDGTVFTRDEDYYLQSVSLNDLTDVDAASNKNDGAVMQWSSVLNRFVLSNTLDLRIEGSDLLADNSPTAGQVYQYNGTTFQWATVTSGGITSLNDIGDVSVPSPNTNDVLSWNGSTWVASASGGGSADGVVNGATFIGGLLSLQRSLGLADVTVNLDGRYLLSTHPASGVTTASIAEWDAAYANIISGLTFDSSTGNLTATRPQGGDFVTNFDGRYLDDGKEVTNIAFSGSSTKTLTMTFADASTLTASFIDNSSGGGGQADGVVSGATFNTSNGELSLSRTESLPDVVVDLDGRYLTDSSFEVTTAGTGPSLVTNGGTLNISGAQGIVTNRFGVGTDIEVRILLATEGVTTGKIAPLAVTDAKIADDTISEPKLDIHNAPTSGQVLGYTVNGLEWVSNSGGGSADGVVSGATFNTSNGILSLSRTQGLSDVTVDLDGRYKRSAEFTFVGNASNGAADNVIDAGETFSILGAEGITTGHGLNDNELIIAILPSSINEDKLNIVNSPQDGEVLSYDSGDMVWTPPPASVRGAECSANSNSGSLSPSSTVWFKMFGFGSVTSFGTSFVSQTSNTFTVSEAGVYEVSGSVWWEATSTSGTTYVQTGISINNANPAQGNKRGFFAPTATASEWVDVKGIFNLSANDTITLVYLGDADTDSAEIFEAHINFKKLQ